MLGMFDPKKLSESYKASWSEFRDARKAKQSSVPTDGPENLFRVTETRDEQITGFPTRKITASDQMMSSEFLKL